MLLAIGFASLGGLVIASWLACHFCQRARKRGKLAATGKPKWSRAASKVLIGVRAQVGRLLCPVHHTTFS